MVLVLFSWKGEARNRLVAPLMPPRERASVLPTQRVENTNIQKVARAERTALGFEAGFVGIQNNSTYDFAKLQLLYGIRANAIIPLSRKWFLKPSLGYFMKPESEGDISIRQNLIEGGLEIHHSLMFRGGFLWHLGLSQRADYLFSRISVPNSSANTPGSFRYRIGAVTGLRIRLNTSSDLTFDLEGGVAPFEALRAQTSFSTGLIFFLD